MVPSRTSVTAVADEVRGPGSNTDSSPNMSDGPITASRFSRPSGECRPSLTLPDRMMNSRSPSSPSEKIALPRAYSTVSNCEARAAAASGSTPWKIPAFASVSSTLSS